MDTHFVKKKPIIETKVPVQQESKLCMKCGKRYSETCHKAMVVCFRCGLVGHMIKDCPTPPTIDG